MGISLDFQDCPLFGKKFTVAGVLGKVSSGADSATSIGCVG